MSTNPHLSVIICTHNPRLDYLERTLGGLRTQTLPAEQWELRIIDNASKEPFEEKIDLSWHPDAAVVREDELGLTPARLKGISIARAETLVFFDDDNVASEDYLQQALKLAEERPYIGSWGGNILPEYEVPLPDYAHKVVRLLAIREEASEAWIYCPGIVPDSHFMPWGAGMCVRKKIATSWAESLRENAAARSLGRRGTSLAGGEDCDLALTSFQHGLAVGHFFCLVLTHLIPARRLEKDYLLKLSRSLGHSTEQILQLHERNYRPNLPRKAIGDRLKRKFRHWRAQLKGNQTPASAFNGLCIQEGLKGREQAVLEWRKQQTENK